jgi:hypothetical protein
MEIIRVANLRKLHKLFIYLLIIFLPSQLAFHYQFKSLLSLGLRVDYLMARFYFTDLLVLAILIISFLLFKKEKKTFNFKKILPITILALWGLVQMFWVKLDGTHLFYLGKFAIYGLLVLSFFNKKINKNILIKILSWQLVFLAIFSLIQFLTGSYIGGIFYWIGERNVNIGTPGVAIEQMFGQLRLRPYASFSHPNSLSGYVLLVVMWLVLKLQVFSNNKKLGILAIFSALIIILLGFSQLVWVGTMMLATYLFLQRKNYLNKKTLQILTLLSILFSLISPFLLNLIKAENESILIRNQLFQNNLSLILPKSLYGVGWFGSIGESAKQINFNSLQPIHNSLWLIILSTGLIPIAVFTRQIIIYLKKLDKNSLFLIITLLALGSFDHYLISQQQTLLLSILIFSINKYES